MPHRYSTKLVDKYLTDGAAWGVWDHKISAWAAPRFRTVDKAEVIAETERRNAEEARVVSLLLRLPPPLHERIKARALTSRRSLNSELIAAVEAWTSVGLDSSAQ